MLHNLFLIDSWFVSIFFLWSQKVSIIICISGSWWWIGRLGVLRFMGSQRVGPDWATDLIWSEDFPSSSKGKESACNEGDLGSIPGLGRSPGEGHGNRLQYSCLENSMDRGAWWATGHRVTKSRTRLKWLTHRTIREGAVEGAVACLSPRLADSCLLPVSSCHVCACLGVQISSCRNCSHCG